MKTVLGLTLPRFQSKFKSNSLCEKYLFKQRWPEGFVCPACGHREYCFHSKRKLYQCSRCKHQTSVTAQTTFHKTRTALRKWFLAIFLMASDKGGISGLSLARLIDVSRKTAWTMLHKIRKAMADREARYLLGGLVELEDQVLPGRTLTRPENPVSLQLSLTENGFPVTIKIASPEGLDIPGFMKKLREGVSEDATLQMHFEVPVDENGKKKFIPGKHWSGIVLRNLRDFLNGTYHNACGKHIQKYLDEFSYRFNRRKLPGSWFDSLVTACSATKTITYAELTA